MKLGTKVSGAVLTVVPIAAHADGTPHIAEFMYSFGGGMLGGLLGALLACWLCKRARGSGNNINDPKR